MFAKICQEFIQYERARLKFTQVIGECSSRVQNIAHLEQKGVIDLLQPLICDNELAIRSNAVCCLSRMANHSGDVAKKLIDCNIPEMMLCELTKERNNNIHFRRAILQALRGISKHSIEFAEKIVDCGGLNAFLVCLEDPDSQLKEAACCGIGSIVRQSSELTMIAISLGATNLLILTLQNPGLNNKQFATLVLTDISKHSIDTAKSICDLNGIFYLSNLIDNLDIKLKRYALCTLAHIASHTVEFARLIVNSENVLSKIFIHLGHENIYVQQQAARLVKEIAKHHNLELAQIIVNNGGIGPLVQCLMNSFNYAEDIITSSATALGYLAGQSPYFALAIVECKGVVALTMLLDGKKQNCQLGACVWALGHIGKHSSEHSKILADTNTYTKIIQIYFQNLKSYDLKFKCIMTLKMCLECCLDIAILEPLIYSAPNNILKIVLKQISKILPKDAHARRIFQTIGGLKKIQEISSSISLKNYISGDVCCDGDGGGGCGGGDDDGGGGDGGVSDSAGSDTIVIDDMDATMDDIAENAEIIKCISSINLCYSPDIINFYINNNTATNVSISNSSSTNALTNNMDIRVGMMNKLHGNPEDYFSKLQINSDISISTTDHTISSNFSSI